MAEEQTLGGPDTAQAADVHVLLLRVCQAGLLGATALAKYPDNEVTALNGTAAAGLRRPLVSLHRGVYWSRNPARREQAIPPATTVS
jgi:hypothetical protein